MSKKVLIVVAGDSSSSTNGYGIDLDAFAPLYYRFADHGCDMIIASPDGGSVAVLSKTPESKSARRFIESENQCLEKTVSLNQVRTEDFDAMFYPDLNFSMFALAEDLTNAALLSEAVALNKRIGAVGSGIFALLWAVNRKQRPLLSGTRIAVSPNGDMLAKMPDLGRKLQKLGCRIDQQQDDRHPHVVTDGNLITGENAASNLAAADTLLDFLFERSAAE